MNMYTDSVGGQYAGDGMALEAGLYFSQGFRLSPWALLALTLVQVIVAGGTIFGWQALLPVLYETGVYAQSCPGGMDDPEYPCLEQRTKLTLVFSVAGSASAVGALVAGMAMDRLGTKTARMGAGSIAFLGALLLANAGAEDMLWFFGLACLGFGGNGLQITAFHISNLFQGNERLVVSLITGAFAASSCLFTFVRLGYEKMGWDLQLQFTVYAALVAIVTLTSSVYPTKPYTCPEDLEGSDDGLSSRSFPSFAQRGRDMSQHSDSYPTTEAATPSASRDSSWHGGAPARGGGGSELAEPLLGELMAIQEVPMESTSELCLDLSALPLGEQLCTPEWIGLLSFFLVHLLTSTFYLSAVGDQLSCWACGCATRCGVGDGCMGTCTPDAKASGREWLTVFGAVYPLGFITTPICGYLQDRFHLSVLLFFVNGSMLLWQLLAAVPVMEVQMATIVVFASARQFIFSFFFAAVGSSFGYENFGFLTGLANGLSAVVLVFNAPLYSLAGSRFKDTYTYFSAGSLVFFVYGWYLRRRHHRIIDADDAGFSEKNIWPMDFAFRRDRSLSGGDGRDAPSFSLSAHLPPHSEPPS